MVRRCSDKMAKLLMVVFNGVFLACGIAILVVGFQNMKEISSIQSIMEGLSHANLAFLILGGVIVVISFLGCCGALRENKCMITTFMLLLLALLICEGVVGYLAFSNRDKIEDVIQKEAMNSLKSDDKMIRSSWDYLEIQCKCCGLNGFSDYRDLHKDIPSSCCSFGPDQTCTEHSAQFHGDGCGVKIKDLIKDHYMAVGVTALVIGFVEIVGIIFSCCLRGAINERYETV